MDIHKIEDMFGGWFIGNFNPSIHVTDNFEVGYKTYTMGDKEPSHFQKIATEITLIISGTARIGNQIVHPGALVVIPPKEEADFEAITDVQLIAVKFPSIPSDKFVS